MKDVNTGYLTFDYTHRVTLQYNYNGITGVDNCNNESEKIEYDHNNENVGI